MYNEDKRRLKAIIWCGFVHFNPMTQKQEKLSKSIL